MPISGQPCKRKHLRALLLNTQKCSDFIQWAPTCFWKGLCICPSMTQDFIEELKLIHSSRQILAVKLGVHDINAKFLSTLLSFEGRDSAPVDRVADGPQWSGASHAAAGSWARRCAGCECHLCLCSVCSFALPGVFWGHKAAWGMAHCPQSLFCLPGCKAWALFLPVCLGWLSGRTSWNKRMKRMKTFI